MEWCRFFVCRIFMYFTVEYSLFSYLENPNTSIKTVHNKKKMFLNSQIRLPSINVFRKFVWFRGCFHQKIFPFNYLQKLSLFVNNLLWIGSRDSKDCQHQSIWLTLFSASFSDTFLDFSKHDIDVERFKFLYK